MSGGIDSSVSAALLKQAGFRVLGAFMKFWKQGQSLNRCCSIEAEKRARKVAKILNIPFYIFNFEREFKKRIVDRFIEDYRKGITPNPCVICNEEIKFGLFLKKARELNADFIATGHYAGLRKKGSRILLIKGKDKNKDQSYFLYRLKESDLKHVLFPLSSYKKEEVYKLAKKFKLPVLNIKESQEICFIPNTINEFLPLYLKNKKGNIIDIKGGVLGKHSGLYFYTIGQRKGINLSNGPYFVLRKDMKNNNLIVTKDESSLLSNDLSATDIHWINEPPVLNEDISAKTRYREKESKAKIIKINNKELKAEFKKQKRALTPGQSLVIYKGDVILGGGVIK